MEIIWTEHAKNDYWQNIDYSILKWNESVAADFILAVEKAIQLIAQTPTIGIKTEFTDIRKIIIIPQITLYYQCTNTTLYLVRFWNNYQNPSTFTIESAQA